MTTPALKYLSELAAELAAVKGDEETQTAYAIRAVHLTAVERALEACHARTYISTHEALNSLPQGTLLLHTGDDFQVVVEKAEGEDTLSYLDSAEWLCFSIAEKDLSEAPLIVLWIPEGRPTEEAGDE